MQKNRWLVHAKAAFGGIGLIVFLWALWAFIAFVPFDRDSHGLVIAGVTVAIFLVVVILLRRRKLVDWHTALYSILFIGFLVYLYTVPIRGELPPEAHELNQQLARQHPNRYTYAETTFYEIAQRYTGPTREYIRQPHRIFFIKEAGYYWNAKGEYVPSHIQAQLYRQLLIASNRFSSDEVEIRTGGCVNSPHGYVVIHHPDREIYADLWAAQNFEEYSFGQRVEMPGCGELEPQPTGKPL